MFSSEEVEKAKKLVAQLGQLNLKQDCSKAKNDKRLSKNKNPKKRQRTKERRGMPGKRR